MRPTLKSRLTSERSIVGYISGFLFLVMMVIGASEKLSDEGRGGLIRWDSAGYYAWLPAAFIYRDFTFDFSDDEGHVEAKEFMLKTEEWTINKYNCGPAIMQAPFFLAGHAWAFLAGHEKSGYSSPYRTTLRFGASFYACLGLFLLGLVLLRYFSRPAAITTLLIIGLGTNLIYYAQYEALMSHVYSFFLYSVMIWTTIQWREAERNNVLWLMALALGLVTLIRLPNIIIVLVPLFWNWRSWPTFLSSFAFLKSWRWEWIYLPVFFMLPLLPQMIYIYSMTGQLWIDAYPNERFFWQDPLIGKVLWSYRKGLWVYAPLTFLGFVGWWSLRNKPGFYALTLFYILNLYVVSCWWIWWYGGSYGMRALTESLVVLSFGIAGVSQWILQFGVGRFLMTVLLPWFFALNILQCHQKNRGILHWDSMSKKAYWDIFGLPHPVHPKIMENRDKHLKILDPNILVKDRHYRRTSD